MSVEETRVQAGLHKGKNAWFDHQTWEVMEWVIVATLRMMMAKIWYVNCITYRTCVELENLWFIKGGPFVMLGLLKMRATVRADL